MYLGFVISKEGLKMDSEKVPAIVEWPSPKNVFKVQSFHGLASFYKKIIRNFSYINAPMLETIRRITNLSYGLRRLKEVFRH